jgi:uridine kinase
LDENLKYDYLEKQINNASKLIKNWKRILCCWNGSSIPSVMLLYSELLKKWYNIIFVKPTLLNEINIEKDDLLILSTFGWSRWLIKSITEKFLYNSSSDIIVMTSKIHKIDIYAYNEELKNRVNIIKIFPNEEDLFCRPVSSLIAYIIVIKLICKIIWETFLVNNVNLSIKLRDDFAENYLKLKNFLFDGVNLLTHKKIIVLSSWTMLWVSENVSLAFKEWSWIYADYFDIEEYWHWNYVPDMINIKNTFYILISSSNNDFSKVQINRIRSLLSITNNKIFLDCKDNEIYWWIEILYNISNFILNINKITNFDMNNPIWINENKDFHKTKNYDFTENNILFIIEDIKKIYLENKKQNKLTIVWVSWWSASWKTSTITPKIYEILSKFTEVSIINLDNFQKWKSFVDSIDSKYKYDDKRNFSLDEVVKKLELLKKWEKVTIPRFSLELIAREQNEFEFFPNDIVILEWIYATDEIFDEYMDYKIYVDDEVINMLTKRILRYWIEMKLKNWPVWALKQYLKYVLPAHIDILLNQKNTSDAIIKSNFDFRYCIEKYNLKWCDFNINSKEIIFLKEKNNLQLISTKTKFYINYLWLNYYNFELNDEVVQVILNSEYIKFL